MLIFSLQSDVLKLVVRVKNAGDEDEGGFDGILTRFRSHFATIVAFQTDPGEAVPSTLGNVFDLTLGHPDAVAGHLKECEDVRDSFQGRVSSNEKERDELKEFVSSLKDLVKKRLVAKESWDTDIVVLGFVQD